MPVRLLLLLLLLLPIDVLLRPADSDAAFGAFKDSAPDDQRDWFQRTTFTLSQGPNIGKYKFPVGASCWYTIFAPACTLLARAQSCARTHTRIHAENTTHTNEHASTSSSARAHSFIHAHVRARTRRTNASSFSVEKFHRVVALEGDSPTERMAVCIFEDENPGEVTPRTHARAHARTHARTHAQRLRGHKSC